MLRIMGIAANSTILTAQGVITLIQRQQTCYRSSIIQATGIDFYRNIFIYQQLKQLVKQLRCIGQTQLPLLSRIGPVAANIIDMGKGIKIAVLLDAGNGVL